MIEESPDASVVASEFSCVITSRLCPTSGDCWASGYCLRSRPRPDKKKEARKKDVAAMRRKLLMVRECYACHGPASDGHHIIFRSMGGDDVVENIAPLCHTCHMVLHASTGQDAIDVRTEIGQTLLVSELGEIEYVLRRLGMRGGCDYLYRRYHIEVPVEMQQAIGLEIGDRVVWRLTDGDPED